MPYEYLQPIVDAAYEAQRAFWCDLDESKLYPAMKRLADLFRALRVDAEVRG